MEPLQRAFYHLVQGALRPALEKAVKVRVVGKENIPVRGPGVLICNHRSDNDPFLLSLHLERPIHWMAARYLFNIPLVREFFQGVGAIPISRKPEVLEEALRRGGEVLEEGELVGIFPEGWGAIADRDPRNLHKFHTGFARIALPHRAPVIPAAIIGLEEAEEAVPIPGWLRELWGFPDHLRTYNTRVVFRSAEIRIGKPRRWGGPVDEENLHRVAEEARGAVQALMEPRGHRRKGR
ncbi:MAG: 1-acyl-sn-glycerol-3-phosphate acyltransferase [Euryarchaeota archaeon]|nr:1-acyl-sn-glycerol-3-phosphate acyltransferase [Euryarchaeota archaeon]